MEFNNNKIALTFDDINIVPCSEPCTIRSRKEIDLTTQFTKNYKLKIPIVASPMDTICDSKMAIAMYKLGGLGVIHRFMSIHEQIEHVWNVVNHIDPDDIGAVIAAAIGVTGDYLERAISLTEAGVNVLFLDTAHGNHINTKEAIYALRKAIPDYVDIVPGNVAHYDAALNLVNWGFSCIRTGIGNGSVCSTRTQTKVGIPSVTSLIDCCVINIPVMMDGGMRNSGDIALSLALGASSIMTGSLLSGTEECPGEVKYDFNGNAFKPYRGSASYESKIARGEKRNIEGVSTTVPYKGSVERIVNDLVDGIKSSMSYVNARTISEFQAKVNWIQVTQAGFREAQPHKIMR